MKGLKWITRDVFDKMKEKGLICENYNNKNFYISSSKKKSKRKKIYICEKVLAQYNRIINPRQGNWRKRSKNKT